MGNCIDRRPELDKAFVVCVLCLYLDTMSKIAALIATM